MDKFLNKITMHINLFGFHILYGVKQYIKCQHTTYDDTTKQNGYLPQIEQLWSRDILATN